MTENIKSDISPRLNPVASGTIPYRRTVVHSGISRAPRAQSRPLVVFQRRIRWCAFRLHKVGRGCPEGQRCAFMVSMKWRYPNGGRLVSRIEAGNTKGQARPFVRGQAAKGLCASKPHRVGRWGLGNVKLPHLVQQG